MKLKRQGKCEVAVKLDMSKAYDRIEWDFLGATMVKLGFCKEWVNRVLWCLNSVQFSVMLSGKRISRVGPQRGLRQGDPLSPYLFILVNNVLSKLIEGEKRYGRLKGIKMGRGGPEVTHSFFADDSVFFLSAEINNCMRLKEIIDIYCKASGQLINMGKSCLYFSKNTPDVMKEEIGHIFQIYAVDIPGNYLGLPIVWGRSKSQALNFVIDRMQRKAQGWKRNLLSEAGRETLIKSIANSLPVYSMSCFRYPKRVLQKLDSIVSRFWWNGDEETRKVHWVSMEKMKRHKLEGGMGFKDFDAFNLALLAKVGWRILKFPNQLWVRLLKAKYFPRHSFFEARKGRRASWLWSSILEGRRVLENQVILSIGNGREARVWKDPWISELPRRRMESQCPLEALQELRVEDLLTEDGWDLSPVQDWISDRERSAILKTIVAPRRREDKWLWTGGKGNQYTVKDGYVVARRDTLQRDGNCPESSNHAHRQVWKEVWKLKIPYKARNFLWRLLMKALPTMQNLAKRKCCTVDICLICQKKLETWEHLFFECEWTVLTWFGSNLSLKPNVAMSCGTEQWIVDYLCNSNLSQWQKSLFVMTLWQIWKARNAWIFESCKPDPVFTFTQAGQVLYELWEVKKWAEAEGREPTVEINLRKEGDSWKLPEGNTLKINTDCAYDPNSNKAAVAFVVRDMNGWLLDGETRIIEADSAFMGEAIAFLDALKFSHSNQLSDICLESDNQSLINCINNDSSPSDWRCSNILEHIQESRKLIGNHTCCWISRKANLVADWVAKASLGGYCPVSWVCYPPNTLRNILENDVRSVSRDPG